jgi:hypothetical protein
VADTIESSGLTDEISAKAQGVLMVAKTTEQYVPAIEAEIARHEDGIGIDDLHKVLADIVSRRTLQRRV